MISALLNLLTVISDLTKDIFKYYTDPEIQEYKRKRKDKAAWDKMYKEALEKRDKRSGLSD